MPVATAPPRGDGVVLTVESVVVTSRSCVSVWTAWRVVPLPGGLRPSTLAPRGGGGLGVAQSRGGTQRTVHMRLRFAQRSPHSVSRASLAVAA
jgi:hypothetical protein